MVICLLLIYVLVTLKVISGWLVCLGLIIPLSESFPQSATLEADTVTTRPPHPFTMNLEPDRGASSCHRVVLCGVDSVFE